MAEQEHKMVCEARFKILLCVTLTGQWNTYAIPMLGGRIGVRSTGADFATDRSRKTISVKFAAESTSIGADFSVLILILWTG